MARIGFVAENFELDSNDLNDKLIIDFLKRQMKKKIRAFRLGMSILILLFGKDDLAHAYRDIEKYGLINILEKRLLVLKKESSDYVEKL
jgi:hypothetical protein